MGVVTQLQIIYYGKDLCQDIRTYAAIDSSCTYSQVFASDRYYHTNNDTNSEGIFLAMISPKPS